MASGRQGNGSVEGLVFNIQKFSLHDGPGIRTIVFLKGCPLTCPWCSNPEAQSRRPELGVIADRCIGVNECDRCIAACPARSITASEDGKISIDRVTCDGCPAQALEVIGRRVSVDDVLRIVEEDDAFYARSGGGLTVSGGEPLAQGAFVRALLEAARSRGIDTAIETCGLCSWKTLSEVAPLADRIFFDVKCLDADEHERVTGVSNRIILENFRRLRTEFPDVTVIVRTAVIPGINDSEAEIVAIARFIDDAGGASFYELLPYHGLGEPKYVKLGKAYRLGGVEPPSAEHMKRLEAIAMQSHAPFHRPVRPGLIPAVDTY
jgi:pyruvate formate lyase activating enzyme